MKLAQKIYLDYNATTPTDPEVVAEMLPYFTEKFGNASSISHAFGWEAEEAVERAYEQVSHLINANPNELYFTAGATESINIALRGIAKSSSSNGNHIITSLAEHKAVLETCKSLEEDGFLVTYLSIDKDGKLDLDELRAAITDKTSLISIMAANNETGIIHPLKTIVGIAHQHGIPVFSDATQAVGKIPFDVSDIGVDIIAFSAHKMYGPKGMGALYLRKKSKLTLQPLITGGGQQNGIRPGTHNVPGIVGFGKASSISKNNMHQEAADLTELRDFLETELTEQLDCIIIGKNSPRLPHVSSILFNKMDGSRLIHALKRIAVSQGSACTSNVIEPSHVLIAMGISVDQALSAIRISLGRFTTKEDIALAILDFKQAIHTLSKQPS